MTTDEQKLSLEQKELVAVGASVGADCHPCVDHHLKAAAKAGVDGERRLAAVTSAERVTAEAAVAMGDHLRGKLGSSVTEPALLSRLEEALASFGAALGAQRRDKHRAPAAGRRRAGRLAATAAAGDRDGPEGAGECGADPPARGRAPARRSRARGRRRDRERVRRGLRLRGRDRVREDVTRGRGAGASGRDERRNGVLQQRDGSALRRGRSLCRDRRMPPDVRAVDVRSYARRDRPSAAHDCGGRLMQEGGLMMSTIAAISLPVADSWGVYVVAAGSS